MNNTRFSTAIHIMTLLAKFPEEWLTSDYIAGSINLNPVIIRKEIGSLKEASLIMVKKGKEGGAKLAKDASQISLAEIYRAVKNSEVLGKKNQDLNPYCMVGKNINNHLEDLYSETNEVMVKFLSKKSLQEFSNQFR